MQAQLQSLPIAFGPAYIRRATVKQPISRGVYGVILDGGPPGVVIPAHLATPLDAPLAAGDQVLVAGENPSAGYVIGVLASSGNADEIRTPGGAGARIAGDGPAQCIAVHDDRGRTVFEYYPENGKSVLNAVDGDLQLAAPNGTIDLAAGRGICCRSAEKITLDSQTGVQLCVGAQENPVNQNFNLNPDGIRSSVHQVTLTAGRAEASIAHATYSGRQLNSRISRARLVYDRLETSARRLWERSENSIRQVLHLCQVRAGRMRTLVKDSHHLQSERTTVVARKEVRIDGEKINLG